MPASMPSTVNAEPPDGQAHVAWQLRDQARACAALGSGLYDRLLSEAAADVEAGGPAWEVLRHHVAPGRGDAVALRLMAAVHRLVLTGRTPRLAPHYPSVGGTAEAATAWEAFRDVLDEHRDALVDEVAQPCQTNEVGRCAGLVFGFLEVAAATRLPLRLLEVGASAGLNLRWDRFHYGGGGAAWGDHTSPVDLTGMWAVPPPSTDIGVRITERAGCDLRPVDVTMPEGRLAVTASIWADQPERFARLKGALTIAEEVPALVERASLDSWVGERLAHPVDGVVTVVYHSVVDEYLPDGVRRGFHGALAQAGARATDDAPLAWLRLEPVSALRRHGVRLTTWPGATERMLAICGAHGQEARPVAP